MLGLGLGCNLMEYSFMYKQNTYSKIPAHIVMVGTVYKDKVSFIELAAWGLSVSILSVVWHSALAKSTSL